MCLNCLKGYLAEEWETLSWPRLVWSLPETSCWSLIFRVKSPDLVIFNEHVVNDVAPEVGEHEGAGDQEVEHSDFDFADGEGEAEDVEAESEMNKSCDTKKSTITWHCVTYCWSPDPPPPGYQGWSLGIWKQLMQSGQWSGWADVCMRESRPGAQYWSLRLRVPTESRLRPFLGNSGWDRK